MLEKPVLKLDFFQDKNWLLKIKVENSIINIVFFFSRFQLNIPKTHIFVYVINFQLEPHQIEKKRRL